MARLSLVAIASCLLFCMVNSYETPSTNKAHHLLRRVLEDYPWNAPGNNISFHDAVLLEAAIHEHQRQLASHTGVLLPANVSEDLIRIAKAMPVLQLGQETKRRIESTAKTVHEQSRESHTMYRMQRRQSALRVMIVGDSMTQGQQGDYTWRYRIWQWFQQNSIAVQFVGPYTGTFFNTVLNPGPPTAPSVGPNTPPVDTTLHVSGGYAIGTSSGWDSHHFAVWGRAAAVDKGLISNVLSQNNADMMLLMLGFNDMGWFYSDAYGTLDSIHTIINNARAINPSMKFAVANVPRRTFIGGRQDLVDNTDTYNKLIANAIPQWTTAQSPISLVHLQETYSCDLTACPSGYDGLHPNEYGEYQIASAFSQALHNDFNMGSGPLAIPASIPARPLPVPSNFQVFSSPQGVTATWDAIYGSYSYDVQQTLNGGTALDFSATATQSNRWDSHWPLDGFVYNVQVRASAGDRKGAWTNAISATAHPQLAGQAQNLRVTPSATGFDLSWSPPTGPYTDSIQVYNVIHFDEDSCDYLTGSAFSGSPGHIDGQIPGHRVFSLIEVWNANGAGFPIAANLVKPGLGTPGAPSGLVITALDGASAQINVNAINEASGYALWSRNVNQAGSVSQRLNGTSGVPCFDNYFLFPGVQNFEFCVSAYNGNLEGPKGPCAVAPSPSSSTQAASCPTAPGWCANGPSAGSNSPTGGGGSPNGGTPTSSTVAGALPPSAPAGSTPYPIVSNGQCKGPDCQSGRCVGLLCASFGCTGSKCSNGVCTGADCIVTGCIGPNCKDGVCGSGGCISKGCVGADCGSGGSCTGLNCISLGCTGTACNTGTGVCSGPSCSESWCHGLGCANGVCTSTCTDAGVDAGGSGPGNVPTVTPSPAPTNTPTTTTISTTCKSPTTVSSCAVTCDIIIGDEPNTSTCGSATCSSTTSGCSVRGKTTTFRSTWSCTYAPATTGAAASTGGGSGGGSGGSPNSANGSQSGGGGGGSASTSSHA